MPSNLFHSDDEAPTRRSWAIVSLTTWICFGSIHLAVAIAHPTDDPDAVQPDSGKSIPTEVVPVSDEVISDEDTFDEVMIEQLVEDLGSSSFAKRERAANRLMSFGNSVVEPMQKILDRISDPEAVDRGERIIDALVGEDTAKKIDAFLSGEDINFKGWRSFRNIFGEKLAARELFIEVRSNDIDLLNLLDSGTPREIAIETRRMVDSANKQMFTRMQLLSRGEVVALFLPVSDSRVPISKTHERLLYRLLNQSEASSLRAHAQLKIPFGRLVSELLKRSSNESRFDALLFGISWKLDSTKDIAIETLKETVAAGEGEAGMDAKPPYGLDSVTIAMRAISRFGDQEDSKHLEPFLNDTRQATDDSFRDNTTYRVQVADVAMASMAMLYNVSLQEIGYPDAVQTRARVLYPSELGFPVDQPELRTKNRNKLMRIIKAIRESEPDPPSQKQR